jgi:hypothetical protein
MGNLIVSSLMLALFCLSGAPEALALRCGHDVVTSGDSKLEVLKKCGEPMLEERHFEEFRKGVDTHVEKRVGSVVDEWTYNFGPHDFLYFLKFANGILVDIETGDYGFDSDMDSGLDRCRHGQLLAEGDTTAEVLKKCGEPDLVERWYDETILREDRTLERRTTVPIEQWTYNFGPRHFIHILKFRKGRLADIEIGGYGFDPEK